MLALLGDSVTTDHISPAGNIRASTPGGAVVDRARRRAARLQLLRRAPRQPRGDGARHVRQRAPAQPARARHRGRLHGASPRRRADDDLRRARCSTRDEGVPLVVHRGQGVRLRARRATGRRRARCCSACARCSPRASSASTARTSSAWACCRSSSCRGSPPESLGLTGHEAYRDTGRRGGGSRRAASRST